MNRVIDEMPKLPRGLPQETVSSGRAKAFRLLAILFMFGVVLWAGLTLLSPDIIWDGGANFEFEIAVVDKATTRPIPGATIEQSVITSGLDQSEANQPGGRIIRLTDESGILKGPFGFPAGGDMKYFMKFGEAVFTADQFNVSAPGYHPVQFPVSKYAGELRSIHDRRTIHITVELTPKEPYGMFPTKLKN